MKFTIFLSHHETETDLAQRMRTFLERMSQEIEVKTFVQKANPDADFRKWVNESLYSSHMFVFLYTDDTRELSWAAHELGIYLGAKRGASANIVCLKSQDISDMPAVMSHIAPIDATDEGIRGCLEDILVKGLYNDNRRLANDTWSLGDLQREISHEAAGLANLFRSKIHTEYFADRLIIRDIRSTPRSDFVGEISPKAHVELSVLDRKAGTEIDYVLDFSHVKIEANDHVKRLLRLPQDDCSWFDIVHLGERAQTADRFDLANEVLRHASSQDFHAASEMMLAEIELNGTILIPIISRVEKRDRLPVSYYLLLIPDPASRDEEIGKHEDLAEGFARDVKLVLMLSMARRFRWNLVEPFIWKIRRAIGSPEELKGVIEELMAALREMELEGERAKVDDGHLASLYFPAEHRENLKELWISYYQIRRDLAEKAEALDARSILEHLTRFQEMNRKFMETGLEVYKQTMVRLPTLDEAHENWREDFFDDQRVAM